MKQLLALLLTLAVLLSLAACSGATKRERAATAVQETPDEATAVLTAPEQTDPPTEATTEETTEATDDALEEFVGTLTGQHYENEALGLACDLPQGWVFATEQERAELMGSVASAFDDESIARIIENSGAFIALYASNGTNNLNIALEQMPVAGLQTDTDTYIETLIPLLEQMYTSSGYSVHTLEKCTLEFAGQSVAAVSMSGEYYGLTLYQKQIPVPTGKYFYSITVTSMSEDTTGEILAFFSALD